MNEIKTIYEALPDDVKRKVSLHDLKRIADALNQSASLVEKPRPDSLRLDHLEAHGEEIRLTYQRGWPTMDNSSPPKWRFWCWNEGTTTRPTVREAIDAAMSAPKEKGTA